MLKPAVVLAVLLFAGCAAPQVDEPVVTAQARQPAAAEAVEAPLVATLTRVEPVLTLIDRTGRFDTQVCRTGLSCLLQQGLGIAPQRQNVTVADALLWRASLTVEWTNRSPEAPPVRLSLWALEPCAGGDEASPCVRESRTLVSMAHESPVRLPPDDLFLRPGETGLQVRLDLARDDPTDGALGSVDVEYHLHGWVAGYVAVAPPQQVEWQPTS